MARRNYTQELLAQRKQGAHIVVSLAPHTGVPVTYQPRHIKDPEPWVAGLAYRFNGRECHAIPARDVSIFDLDRFMDLLDRLFNGAFDMGQDDFRFDFETNHLVPVLARLVSLRLLERKGGSYFITSEGYTYLAELRESAA